MDTGALTPDFGYYAWAGVFVSDAIMMRGKPLGVDTMIVDGEVILSGERFTRIDEVAVMTELAETLAGPRTEDEEHRRKMV